MRAKLTSLQGTIEAEGSPEELAKFFREYAGLNWTLTGDVASSGTIKLTPSPVSVPSIWPRLPGPWDACPMSADGLHKYPSLWMSVSPAPCEKCGKSSGSVVPHFTVVDPQGTLTFPVVAHTNTCASAVGVSAA